MKTMKTNANSLLLATLLKDARVGTFTGLVTTKKGIARGKGTDRKTFGDDTVHVTILTGFSYKGLVERSLKALDGVNAGDIVAYAFTKGITDKNGQPITLADVAEALSELQVSFSSTLDGTNESTTDHVYDPLVVDGETVRGSRVYKCVAGSGVKCHCRNCSGDEKAPLPGTIYLQGLQIYSKVLVPAVNGPAPAAQSAAKTIAKDLIKKQLPIRRYAQYILEPGQQWLLRAGGTAALEAEARGFIVTDEILEAIQKIA